MRVHIFGDFRRVRLIEAKIQRRITRAHHLGIGERLRVEPPRFQHEYFHRRGELRQHLGNHHVFHGKAAGELDPPETRANIL